MIKKTISLLTFKGLNVSSHRKRVFRITLLLLLTLYAIRLFKTNFLLEVPYFTELINVLILTLAANVLANIARLLMVSSHRRRRGIANDEKDNFTVGINALVNAFTAISLITSVFIVFQIDLRSFLSSIALFAVALTLIFQDFIKNFLFGLSMMFSSDYEIGDYIQVGTMQKGVITTITFSNVQIRTEAGHLLFVPNSVIRIHEVTNLSKLKPKEMIVEFTLLREQISSIDVLERSLLKQMQINLPDLLDIESSYVEVRSSEKDTVTFAAIFLSQKASLRLKEKLNKEVQKFAIEFPLT